MLHVHGKDNEGLSYIDDINLDKNSKEVPETIGK